MRPYLKVLVVNGRFKVLVVRGDIWGDYDFDTVE